ncbi:unnamed protein product [Rangifer tarandus platyrhynchus]|uniref:Uncharacterized protein n=1 Tax=Rangifer tarandus platyrhynchus TaxID=3082113 RepID=A0AC59YSV6_RANTA
MWVRRAAVWAESGPPGLDPRLGSRVGGLVGRGPRVGTWGYLTTPRPCPRVQASWAAAILGPRSLGGREGETTVPPSTCRPESPTLHLAELERGLRVSATALMLGL